MLEPLTQVKVTASFSFLLSGRMTSFKQKHRRKGKGRVCVHVCVRTDFQTLRHSSAFIDRYSYQQPTLEKGAVT